MTMYELRAVYGRQKAYYGRAFVIVDSDGKRFLRSYNTIVSVYDPATGTGHHLGRWSRTTSRHQAEFRAQAEADGIRWIDEEKTKKKRP